MHHFIYLQNMDDNDTDRTDVGRDEETPEVGDLGGQTGDVPVGSNNPGRGDMYEGGVDDDAVEMDEEDFGLGS